MNEEQKYSVYRGVAYAVLIILTIFLLKGVEILLYNWYQPKLQLIIPDFHHYEDDFINYNYYMGSSSLLYWGTSTIAFPTTTEDGVEEVEGVGVYLDYDYKE